MALVVAFGMMAVVLWMWQKILQQLLGVDSDAHGGKWYRDSEKVFRTVIPRNVRLGEAPSHGMPVILYDVKSRGAEAYLALGEYQFQDNDLTGALDTWEHGLRLIPERARVAAPVQVDP